MGALGLFMRTSSAFRRCLHILRQRLAFQEGRAPVCVYTVEEGISLHEGEYGSAKRANLIHDPH
jgi:hypothetical protein